MREPINYYIGEGCTITTCSFKLRIMKIHLVHQNPKQKRTWKLPAFWSQTLHWLIRLIGCSTLDMLYLPSYSHPTISTGSGSCMALAASHTESAKRCFRRSTPYSLQR